ncbi:Fcf2 pre-rRNA processing-domain-containing protein [Biscogniauxia mediterranea]|nr:Fcf2 pre-rRNA processing-domain-containing protein [Biscogniauxia mediterranea]
MADTTVDLSEEQIDQLLKEAEVRLSAKQQEHHGNTVTAPSKAEVTKPPPKAKVTAPKSTTTAAAAAVASSTTRDLSVRVPQPRRSKKEMATKTDAGALWFNLPKTEMTPEVKRHLQLLRMRDVLDPKRHYKKDTSKSLPEFSVMGTVMEGPTDFYSSRLTKKEKKRSLVEEVLEAEDATRRFKRKYNEIQAVKTSGKKGHYKKMMQRRYGRKG